jgi:hypothetical protein
VLAVAAVVAVAATGAGLLVPGVDLPASARQTVRIGGETVPLSFDSTGDGGEGGLRVPGGIDRTTGEVGIIGIVNPETGEVGIIGGHGSGVDMGELDPATLDGLVEITGGDLGNIGVIGTIDPGRRPDGRIDFSRYRFSDVELDGPAGIGDGIDNVDWERIAREIEAAPRNETGAANDDAGTTANVDRTNDADSRPRQRCQVRRACCSAASTVCASSTAMVMGPTPPGTGVIRLARSRAVWNSTSPTLPRL